jgi:ferredoxin
MMANYGYEDGTGTYYIKINTLSCAKCSHKNCVNACPSKLFRIKENDWGDEIIVIIDQFRNDLLSLCIDCKSLGDGDNLYPCQRSCDMNSISHSW